MELRERLYLVLAGGLVCLLCGCGGGGGGGSNASGSSGGGSSSSSGGSSSGGSSSGSMPSSKITHVVIIVQENRTPDNLFHGLPNADIANSGVNSSGQTITLHQVPLDDPYDLSHAHAAFLDMYDNGKMDGADKIPVSCPAGDSGCAPADPQFGYVNPSDVAPYFALAEQYSFADRMFQTNQGPSFPAHQFLLAGTSEDQVGSQLFAAENPPDSSTNPNGAAGCYAATQYDAVVEMINIATGAEDTTEPPCFEHPTLSDLLDQAGVTWRYYAPSANSIWTAPNAIAHIRNGADWANVIIPQSQVLTDIQNQALADVSWVIPTGQESDHAAINNGTGPSWVASIVNAIGGSSYWSNTAIFIVWDDWGGWYDHVAPSSIANAYEYGFRVPLIVVSPYAKLAYVSHVNHDFGSILHFVEETYALPSLGNVDAAADDLADCFDFSQTPTSFQPVAARYNADYFLSRSGVEVPLDPDDD
jgi:phospholipase C